MCCFFLSLMFIFSAGPLLQHSTSWQRSLSFDMICCYFLFTQFPVVFFGVPSLIETLFKRASLFSYVWVHANIVSPDVYFLKTVVDLLLFFHGAHTWKWSFFFKITLMFCVPFWNHFVPKRSFLRRLCPQSYCCLLCLYQSQLPAIVTVEVPDFLLFA